MSTLNLPHGYPAPTRVRTPADLDNTGKPRRAHTWLFIAASLPTDGNGDTLNAVEVTVSHNSTYKRYEAEVWAVTTDGRVTSKAYWIGPSDGEGTPAHKTLATQATARYSAKALDAFAAHVLDSHTIEVMVADTKAAPVLAAIRAEQTKNVA